MVAADATDATANAPRRIATVSAIFRITSVTFGPTGTALGETLKRSAIYRYTVPRIQMPSDLFLVMPIPVVAVMRIVGIQVSVGPVAIAVGTTMPPAASVATAISAAGDR